MKNSRLKITIIFIILYVCVICTYKKLTFVSKCYIHRQNGYMSTFIQIIQPICFVFKYVIFQFLLLLKKSLFLQYCFELAFCFYLGFVFLNIWCYLSRTHFFQLIYISYCIELARFLFPFL